MKALSSKIKYYGILLYKNQEGNMKKDDIKNIFEINPNTILMGILIGISLIFSLI